MSPCLPRLECPLSVYSFGHGADQREAAVASNFSVLVFLSKNGLKPDLSEQLGADHREARTAAVRPGQPSLPASSKPSSPGSSASTGAALSVVSHRRVSTSSPRLSPGAASASLDSCLVGGGYYRHLGRLGLADKLQFSALLWPPCAKSGTLFLHGGQRETGLPEPHEPGHIRERLKEVRATHARAKKSGPLSSPCQNRSRWRAEGPALADARATTPGGTPPPKPGAWGSR